MTQWEKFNAYHTRGLTAYRFMVVCWEFYIFDAVDLQVPFKHDSLLVDKKEMKLTKEEESEAKRGI